MITLDAAQQHLNMTDPTDVDELAVHVTAASDLVEQFTGPVIVREFTDYQVDVVDGALSRRPVVELVSIAPTFTFRTGPVDVGTLRVHPTRGTLSYASGHVPRGGPFDVTYRAGRVASVGQVPPALGLACRIIVAHLWETQRAVTLGPGMTAGDDFSAVPMSAGFAVPYRARDLLTPYRTPSIA